jgi:hypothetical protein
MFRKGEIDLPRRFDVLRGLWRFGVFFGFFVINLFGGFLSIMAKDAPGHPARGASG